MTQLSRERSWLRFNHRVLLQARRADIPLLEKFQYLAIFSSNSDEFFSARISDRFEAYRRGQDQEEYQAIVREFGNQAQEAAALYRELAIELRQNGIAILAISELSPREQRYFGAYLAERVAPMVDLLDPANLTDLSSEAFYLAWQGRDRWALIRLPESLPRLVPVPGRGQQFVLLEDLVRFRPDLFFAEAGPVWAFRVTRKASLHLREYSTPQEVAKALEGRLDGEFTRAEVEEGFPFRAGLEQALGLSAEEIFSLPAPLDLRFLFGLAKLPRPELRFPPVRFHRAGRFMRDPFAYLKEQDLLLYHPCDDYAGVTRFLEAGVNDQEVSKIRMTLYRLGENNPIPELLLQAAHAGKDVAVLLEGRARFDELENLHWDLVFGSAGVRVIPYPKGYKVHAKALYIERAGENFFHLGTGNYSPENGRLYTDLSYFSRDGELGADLAGFFNDLEAGRFPDPKVMRVGNGVREAMVARIQAVGASRGRIILKLNHLTDPAILAALVAAAEAGAEVNLIVRSSLTLIHPLFKARSIVGRFLEHARVAAFQVQGQWDIWMGSADWMPRNFDDRIELLFPLRDLTSQNKVLRILRAQLTDDANSFDLLATGEHIPVWGGVHSGQSCGRLQPAGRKW